MGGSSRDKVSSHSESGQKFKAVKYGALKTGKEKFYDIWFENKNYLHIKNYNYQEHNQACLNSTYNLLIRL